MKNGYIHDYILLRTAEQGFRALGAEVWREYPVQVQGRRGVIDLFARCRFWQLAVEAGNSRRRVGWEIEKARAAGADGLIVLVPNCRVARACSEEVRRNIEREGVGSLWISVLTLGAFRQWLGFNFPLFSPSFEASKTFPVSSANNITTDTQYPS